MIDRRRFLAGAAAAAASRIATAQPRAEVPRVGMLFAAGAPLVAPRVVAFRDALAAQGLVDGKTIVIEPRYANGELDRLPALAQSLVDLPAKVIVTGGSSATEPAAAATSRIPIVMAQDNDPVGAGFVRSLARPGGNVTGLSTLLPELSAKQLSLLAEMVPGVTRIAVVGDSGEAASTESLNEAKAASARLGLAMIYLDRRNVGGPAQLFAAAARSRAGAMLVLASGFLFARQDEIIALALRDRMPALYAHTEFVRRGGLATYGVYVPALFQRAAGYVVRILNGANPADLPVEQPTRFELVLNLRTARAIGISIPTALLLRADEVIQ